MVWKTLSAGGNRVFVGAALTGLGLLLLAAFSEAVSAYEEPITVVGGVLLCSSCGHVDEVESRGLETLLSQIADEHGFRPDDAVVEIKGVCGTCAVDEPH